MERASKTDSETEGRWAQQFSVARDRQQTDRDVKREDSREGRQGGTDTKRER